MKWGAGIVAAILALFLLDAGWRRWAFSGRAPWIVSASFDLTGKARWGIDPYTRCLTPVTYSDGIALAGSVPNRQCYSFDPPRRFRGIYIDEFEGQQFIENAVPAPKYVVESEDVWLSFDRQSRLGPLTQKPDDGRTRIWLIDFVGRKTMERGYYGHRGGSDREIVVDAVSAARLLSTFDGYAPETVLVRR